MSEQNLGIFSVFYNWGKNKLQCDEVLITYYFDIRTK